MQFCSWRSLSAWCEITSNLLTIPKIFVLAVSRIACLRFYSCSFSHCLFKDFFKNMQGFTHPIRVLSERRNSDTKDTKGCNYEKWY